MIYLILAVLVLALILAVNLVNVDPMPLDMEDEDDRLDRAEARVVFREWIVRPRAAGDRFQDRGGQP